MASSFHYRSGAETTPLLPNNNIYSNSSPFPRSFPNFSNNNNNNYANSYHAPYPYHGETITYQDHPSSQRPNLKRFLNFLLILILLIVIFLYTYNYMITDKKPNPPFMDIKNPNEHHLIWKGEQSFDYHLELSNPIIFADGTDKLGSDIEKKNLSSIPKIEFIAKSSSAPPTRKEKVTKKKLDELKKRIARGEENEFYEGVELHYDIYINFYESFRVLSATSSVDGEWKNSDITLISYENSTLIETRKFKIDWSYDLKGVILKGTGSDRTDADPYNVVAYVKGSIDHGFKFSEKEDGSGKLFAETNQTEVGWKMNRRNIYVYEDSPIPAILPALYIMYYDFFQRMSL